MKKILLILITWFFVALQTGDINQDGIVNFRDYALLLQHKSGGPSEFDVHELRLMTETWLIEIEQ